MPPSYVVAIDRPVSDLAGSRLVVTYLGVPTPWRPDQREWWWVEPRLAADRVGSDDYTRFADPADAVAWVLRLQAWAEESAAADPGGRSAWEALRPYVREVD